MLYSTAMRCDSCGMKVVLDQQAAQALVTSSTRGRVLVAYECPYGDGWHVRRRAPNLAD